jgi:DNA (cytosine-5)-methyltransferase 1
MKYLSVCSGIEAATVAWHHMGWTPIAFSEIEKFPSAVLAHHYPNVPNLGDMTKYKEWNLNGTIDILVGGTPCQSFSVAGLRKGLEDPRGNLALTYIGILDKFRPKWCVWENVPGVLSSNGGRDFGSFLGALAELGYGFAYRVLDAQYFGVAQRRRRVFVVGCLGDWRSAAEVLFESDCLRRDTTKGRKTREETTTSFVPSLANCPQTTSNDYSRADGFNMIAYESHPADSRIKEMGETCQTVTSRWGTGGGNVPLVQAFRKSRRAQSVDDYETWVDDGKANTLNTFDLGDIRTTHAVAYPIHPQALLFNGGGKTRNNDGKGNGLRIGEDGEPMNTLTTVDRHMVAHTFKVRGGCEGGGVKGYLGSDEKTFTISTIHNMAVRRLTPTECERLQGFPDNYTDIKPKGKDTPDGPRYKALGNSMAVPVMKWIGQRIQMIENP